MSKNKKLELPCIRCGTQQPCPENGCQEYQEYFQKINSNGIDVKEIKTLNKTEIKNIDKIFVNEIKNQVVKSNECWPREQKQDAGNKFDGGKLRVDLLSIDALKGTADVLTHGSEKYGDRNWENGLSFSRCYGAVLRHIFAWWNGENIDKESGKHHLDCASCELMFLQHFVKNRKYKDKDDRPCK